MPDRYADAVCSRRAELRAERARLVAGHRPEIRSQLALTRLDLSAEIDVTMAELGREARAHIDRGGARSRRLLPAHLTEAVARAQAELPARWTATALPALRRIAAQRSARDTPADPKITLSGERVVLPPPEPPAGAWRALLLAGASGGTWRLVVLPAAVLPMLGLPAFAGPAVLPLGIGLALAALVATARLRAAAADRARLRCWSAEALVALRRGLHAELGRWLLEVEQRTGGMLDAAVARRRGEIDAELRALAVDPAQVPGATS